MSRLRGIISKIGPQFTAHIRFKYWPEKISLCHSVCFYRKRKIHAGNCQKMCTFERSDCDTVVVTAGSFFTSGIWSDVAAPYNAESSKKDDYTITIGEKDFPAGSTSSLERLSNAYPSALNAK